MWKCWRLNAGSIPACLASWSKGGKSEWQFFSLRSIFLYLCVVHFCSRNILISPHCNPLHPNCVDVLTTVYHTLLCSVLDTWSPKHKFSTAAFIQFVQSVLNDLPSTSSTSSTASSNASIFGEHLVDMIWSVDAELDEILVDATTVLSASEEAAASNNVASLLATSKVAKQNVERDKDTVRAIVKKLLVRGTIFAPQPTSHNWSLGLRYLESIVL